MFSPKLTDVFTKHSSRNLQEKMQAPQFSGRQKRSATMTGMNDRSSRLAGLKNTENSAQKVLG